jgi:flagellar biosynthetic protein FliQ
LPIGKARDIARKPSINHERRCFSAGPAEIAGLGAGAAMNGAEVLDLGREAIWVTVLVAAGPMLVGLVVGLVVSVLQTLTQIQEQTLVFIPKILSIFFAILLFLPIMGGLLGSFMSDVFERIAAY